MLECTHKKEAIMRARLGIIVVVLLSVSALQARARCLHRDRRAVHEARLDVDSTCQPQCLQGLHAYVQCAVGVAERRIAAGTLPRGCRNAVTACAQNAACPVGGLTDRVACFRTNAHGVTRCTIEEGGCGLANDRRIEDSFASCCACTAAGCPLRYFYTCGSPVCGPPNPVPGVPDCTTQHQGQPCIVTGEMCNDPNVISSCVGPLLCTTHDPTANGRRCPISRRRYKRNIQYLTPRDAAAVRDSLLRIRLTSYAYKTDPVRKHLGFIIDDVVQSSDMGQSLAVAPDGDTVDLYGYATMAVAAIQTQAREIEGLRREVAALRVQVESTVRSVGDEPRTR